MQQIKANARRNARKCGKVVDGAGTEADGECASMQGRQTGTNFHNNY